MKVSELIEMLKELPQDSRVSVPHIFRLKTGGLRQIECNISTVSPLYDQDTNKVITYLIMPDLKAEDIKKRFSFII